jgi:hypothetical protein
LPVKAWLWFFELCYEWRFDGAILTSKKGKDKKFIHGHYEFVGWPNGKSTWEQYNIVVEIIHLLRDIKTRRENDG